jgi:hypothetical protein
MTMNSSGPISLAGTIEGVSISIENGGNGATQISLNDTAVRELADVLSGPITMPTDFYGKANAFSFTIAVNTLNANLRSLAIAAGWDGTLALIGTINSGVVVYSNSTGTPALTVSGSFPNGVTLVNNGTIVGMGGAGGVGGVGGQGGGAGGGGGTAIIASTNITINNGSGVVAGGGSGGSGGTGGNFFCIGVGEVYATGGGGGGGGRSGLTNSAGGAGGVGQAGFNGSGGNVGTFSAPGTGGAPANESALAGSSGSGWGVGSNCASGSSFITWSVAGTRLGALV